MWFRWKIAVTRSSSSHARPNPPGGPVSMRSPCPGFSPSLHSLKTPFSAVLPCFSSIFRKTPLRGRPDEAYHVDDPRCKNSAYCSQYNGNEGVEWENGCNYLEIMHVFSLLGHPIAAKAGILCVFLRRRRWRIMNCHAQSRTGTLSFWA